MNKLIIILYILQKILSISEGYTEVYNPSTNTLE